MICDDHRKMTPQQDGETDLLDLPPQLRSTTEHPEMPPPRDGKTNFLDLPPELRSIVYHYALVPAEPIEFAPISFGLHQFEEDLNTSKFRAARYTGYRNAGIGKKSNVFAGAAWHVHRYNAIIRSSLGLLRVCRLINEEATPVYYGQEFRFTGTFDWCVLGEWLDLIGYENATLLRNITVGHPALPAYAQEIEGEFAQSPVPTTFPLRVPKNSNVEENDQYCERLNEWMEEVDPWDKLPLLTNLRMFRLIIFNRGREEEDMYTEDFADHPINDFTFPENKHNVQRTLVTLRSDLEGDRNEVRLKKGSEQMTRDFYKMMHDNGWKVKFLKYGNHYSWPVNRVNKCKNRQICRFLRDDLKPNNYFLDVQREAVAKRCR